MQRERIYHVYTETRLYGYIIPLSLDIWLCPTGPKLADILEIKKRAAKSIFKTTGILISFNDVNVINIIPLNEYRTLG